MNEKKSKKTTNIIIVGICIICIIILGIIALLFLKKTSNINDSLLTKVVGSWYVNIVEVYNEDLDKYETRGLSQYFGNEIVESNELIFNSDNTFKCEFLNDSGKYEIDNNKIYMLSNIKEASYKAELTDEELVLILEDNTKIYLSKELKNDNSDDSNEKKAEQILFNEFGEKDELTGNQYSYNYIGIFKDKKSKEYYIFDLKWLVDNNHLSSIGYYAVSLENNDYYFINNTDFKETGIIEIEPKVVKDESDN